MESFFKSLLTGKKEEVAIISNPLAEGKSIGKKHKLVIDNMQTGVEKFYFWFLRSLKDSFCDEVLKVRDIYGASETSSFFGSVEARRAQQQTQASGYLRGINELTQQLFPMIREIKQIDERLQLYEQSTKSHAAEISLKTIWVDKVEGGTQNPSSVLGLSQTGGPGYVTLADNFFAIDIKQDDVDKVVKGLEFNEKVKNMLANKLKQYYIWKVTTHKETKTRKNFMLKALKNHYHTIRIYINWVKPYLKSLKGLTLQNITSDPDLVAAFDTSKIELELLGIKKKDFLKYFPAIKIKIKYVAIPQLAFQQEYQRGAIHLGRSEIEIEPYVVEKKDIENYLKLQEQEDVEILASLTEGMNVLEEDIKKYLIEAGEQFPEEKKEESKPGGVFEPFMALFSSFKDIFAFLELLKPGEKTAGEQGPKNERREKATAEKTARDISEKLYDIFKLTQGLASAKPLIKSQKPRM